MVNNNSEQSHFHIRSYGRTELAQLYRPDIQPASALKKLKDWIKLNKELLHELKTTGYQHSGHCDFTAKQVLLIVNHLGEP